MSSLPNENQTIKPTSLENYKATRHACFQQEGVVRHGAYGFGAAVFFLTIFSGEVGGENVKNSLTLIGFVMVAAVYGYYLWLKKQNWRAMDQAFEDCVRGATKEERGKAVDERTRIDHPSIFKA